MAKTMRNVVIAAILMIVIAGGACALVVTGGCSSAFNFLGTSNPFSGAQVAAQNTLIDQLGVKDRIESELYSHVNEISEATGIPAPVLNAGIAQLDIQDWEAVEKPANAKETSNFTVDADGTPVSVTTYDDTSIVTVEAYGQEVTLGIPESAQTYSDFLPYLQYLQ